MDLVISSLYKIFIFVEVLLVIKRIRLMHKRTSNIVCYSNYIFGTVIYLTAICYLMFILLDIGYAIHGNQWETASAGVKAIILIFLFLSLILLLPLYITTCKYAEFNITYRSIKKKSIDLESSYILLYKPFTKPEKIVLSDIVIEESKFYFPISKESRLFPLAGTLHAEEYLTIKLLDGRKRKIGGSVFLLTDNFSYQIYDLTKKMNIEWISEKQKIK